MCNVLIRNNAGLDKQLEKIYTFAMNKVKIKISVTSYRKPPLELYSQTRDVVYPNEVGLFPTGLAISIGDDHVMGALFPNNWELGNAIGIIDSDFQGEIRVGILNQGHTPIVIQPTTILGKLFFMPIIKEDIEIIQISEKIVMPSYATSGAAGMDIFANESVPITFYPGEHLNVATGFKVIFNKPNIIGLILPRSSMGIKNNIGIGNGVSIIKPDQEVVINLVNRSKAPYTVNPTDKIAQMVFMPIISPSLVKVKEFKAETTRSNEGFGSTGK